MIADFYDLPNLVSCQYMDRNLAIQVDELLGRMIRCDPTFLEAHRIARQAASSELASYEEWLVQQDRVDPASYLFDEDVPY